MIVLKTMRWSFHLHPRHPSCGGFSSLNVNARESDGIDSWSMMMMIGKQLLGRKLRTERWSNLSFTRHSPPASILATLNMVSRCIVHRFVHCDWVLWCNSFGWGGVGRQWNGKLFQFVRPTYCFVFRLLTCHTRDGNAILEIIQFGHLAFFPFMQSQSNKLEINI